MQSIICQNGFVVNAKNICAVGFKYNDDGTTTIWADMVSGNFIDLVTKCDCSCHIEVFDLIREYLAKVTETPLDLYKYFT